MRSKIKDLLETLADNMEVIDDYVRDLKFQAAKTWAFLNHYCDYVDLDAHESDYETISNFRKKLENLVETTDQLRKEFIYGDYVDCVLFENEIDDFKEEVERLDRIAKRQFEKEINEISHETELTQKPKGKGKKNGK